MFSQQQQQQPSSPSQLTQPQQNLPFFDPSQQIPSDSQTPDLQFQGGQRRRRGGYVQRGGGNRQQQQQQQQYRRQRRHYVPDEQQQQQQQQRRKRQPPPQGQQHNKKRPRLEEAFPSGRPPAPKPTTQDWIKEKQQRGGILRSTPPSLLPTDAQQQNAEFLRVPIGVVGDSAQDLNAIMSPTFDQTGSNTILLQLLGENAPDDISDTSKVQDALLALLVKQRRQLADLQSELEEQNEHKHQQLTQALQDKLFHSPAEGSDLLESCLRAAGLNSFVDKVLTEPESACAALATHLLSPKMS